MAKASKILDGLRDAVAGNFAAVTIEGETWVKQGHETPAHQLMETRKHLADLQLQNDVLRSALAPFAHIPSVILQAGEVNKLAKHYWVVMGTPSKSHFTQEDLDRARELIETH
jgi:hypothetical protein